jgi:hypothetical protein
LSNKADSSTVTDLTSRVSSVEQTASNLTSRVSSTESSLSNKADSSTVTDLTSRMASAESSITQNADSIATKVSNGEVISAINQSAEDITINANKINVNGLVNVINEDSSVTCIDGNKIITGTINVDKLTANSITADKIKDNQIFKSLLHFDTIDTVFDSQTIIPADNGDYAQYVITFDGYNSPSGYSPATSTTVIVPANNGNASATINCPAVCFNLKDNVYINEYPIISINVTGASVSGTAYVWKDSNSKINASTNCNVNGTYTYTFSSPPSRPIKRIEFIFTGTVKGGSCSETGKIYKTISHNYTGDFSYPLTSKSNSYSNQYSYSSAYYICPWVSVSLSFVCYLYDDYNVQYEIASKNSSNNVFSKNAITGPWLGELGPETRYYSLSSSYAYTVDNTFTVMKEDKTSKVISCDFTPPSTNLKSSITGAVTRSITTSNGAVGISNPYTVSGSDVVYYDDNKLIYPRYIYGVR